MKKFQIEDKWRGIKITHDKNGNIVELITPYSDNSIYYKPLPK